MQVDMREKQLNIRLSEEEAARFQLVADHFGLNIAGTIRMLFKEKARDLGLESPGLAVAAMAAQGDPQAKARLAAFAAKQGVKPTKKR